MLNIVLNSANMFSFALMFQLLFLMRDFQLSFSQSQNELQENTWNEAIDPCSNKTCKIWTNDIVDCSYSNCRFVPSAIPASIRKLVMASVNVGKIRRDHFKGMNQLTYLDLGNCSLKWDGPILPANVFSDLINLRFLNLSGNMLAVITHDHFRNMKRITHLDLSNVSISTFGENIFEDLINLEVLNISKNPVVWFYFQDFFSKLVNLKTLKLPSWRKFIEFPMYTLKKLTKLEVLWFGPNQFQEFPTFNASKGERILPRLKELSFENNNINRLSHQIKDMNSVETLILSGNRILFINRDAFKHFMNLSRLDLDRNSYLTPTAYNFELPSLKQLSLNYITPSSQVSNLAFKKVANLEELSLKSSKEIFKAAYPFTLLRNLASLNARGNGIRSEMIEEMTRNLRKLRYLDLSDNELYYLESNMFHCRHLEVLLLSDNWLSSVSITSLPLFMWNRLEVVDFSRNPFVCDCTMAWFHHWLANHWGARIAINKDGTICSSPNDLNGTPISRLQIQVAMDCSDPYLKALIVIVLLSNVSSMTAAMLYRFRWQLKYYHFKHMMQTKSEENEEPQDSGIYPYDAFVCYAETERRWVLDVFSTHLETDFELKLCIQDRDWSFGEEVLKNFAFSIENSRKTVLVLSNAFAISPWSHFEMTVAQTTFIEDNRDNLVIVLFEEIASCNMNPMIKLLLMQRNHIEWTNHSVGKELFWAKLKQALTKPSVLTTTSIPQRELFRSLEV